jgi:hypothetical protein
MEMDSNTPPHVPSDIQMHPLGNPTFRLSGYAGSDVVWERLKRVLRFDRIISMDRGTWSVTADVRDDEYRQCRIQLQVFKDGDDTFIVDVRRLDGDREAAHSFRKRCLGYFQIEDGDENLDRLDRLVESLKDGDINAVREIAAASSNKRAAALMRRSCGLSKAILDHLTNWNCDAKLRQELVPLWASLQEMEWEWEGDG